MSDLVGTCPKTFWAEWLAEGDCAGDSPTGETWGWYTQDQMARKIKVGDRFYVVAHGRLRGYAMVTGVRDSGVGSWVIERRGGAVACTILQPIPGFRGLRHRWWEYGDEVAFPEWRTP